ncbi:Repetin [Streptomyces sp. NPDC019396]|uniref:Repetin n=1 Tax=Streptomyces sp. NPDC019396 TaxID=3154687 RepID=UPI0033DF0162
MNRRTKAVVLAVALLIAVGVSGSAVASGDGDGGVRPREAAALTGTAKLYRPAGDDVTFSFDAHLAAKDNMDPHKAHGTFRFSHYDANGAGGWAKVKVDCLMTGGKVAVVTGVVTDGNTPHRGKRVGVTVHDQGRNDRLGYTWIEEGAVADVPRCLGAAPFETVGKGTGDFTVLPWRPEYASGQG